VVNIYLTFKKAFSILFQTKGNFLSKKIKQIKCYQFFDGAIVSIQNQLFMILQQEGNRKMITILGRVTKDGRSLPGVMINLYRTSGSSGRPNGGTQWGSSVKTTITDRKGQYTLCDDGTGDDYYRTSASLEGYVFEPDYIFRFVGMPNITGFTTWQDFTATAITYSISGKVTGPSVSGIFVTLYHKGDASSVTTITDMYGNYSFTGLTNGIYKVMPWMVGYIFNPFDRGITISGANSTGNDFTAIIAKYSISGQVTLNGAGLFGVKVTITGNGSSSATATTGSNGNYSFSDVANGSYTITPSMTGYNFTPESIPVTVSNGDLTGQNFTASIATYSISGQVTLNGAGLFGVKVTIMGNGSSSMITDSNGNYSFSGVASGSYTITPSMTGYNFDHSSISVTVIDKDITGNNFTASFSLAAGSVWTIGRNHYGQLGDGTTNSTKIPVQVIGVDGPFAAISASDWYTLALTSDGMVYAWGDNDCGQLGIGTIDDNAHSTPTQVVGPSGIGFLKGVTAISAGGPNTLALTSDGMVWYWGWPFGNPYPSQVSGLTGIVAIAAGKNFRMALDSTGHVWTWGFNYYGQLGIGTFDPDEYFYTPVKVHNTNDSSGYLTGVIAISSNAASDYAVALVLKPDGATTEVWTWGHNLCGQLCDGTTTDRNVPFKVLIDDVKAISVGSYYTLALKKNGDLWGWGSNNESQLGDGTTLLRNTPVQVRVSLNSGFLTGVKAIAARDCSIALMSDGKVLGWGGSAGGNLGDTHISINPNFPIQIDHLANDIKAIAAGGDHNAFLE
jgi:alpha-tubulin suppressor-like RCC1 family protein